MFNYVGSANPNLVCCICRAPFVEPKTSIVCSHTFCFECIIQCISATPCCPVDRRPLQLENLVPANPIIRHLVDELPVYCPNSSSGCEYTCERQFLLGHIARSCPYSLVQCPQDACDGQFFRKDQSQHTYGSSSTSTRPDLQDDQSQAGPSNPGISSGGSCTCEFCDKIVLSDEIVLHRSLCPLVSVSCEQTVHGCSWTGVRQELDGHLANCPYYGIKGFFEIEKGRLDAVVAENEALRRQNENLHHAQCAIYQDLALIRAAIGPWLLNIPGGRSLPTSQYPPPSSSQSDRTAEPLTNLSLNQPDQALDLVNVRLEDFRLDSSYRTATSAIPQSQDVSNRLYNPDTSTSFRPAVPPPLDSAKSIYENFSDLHNSVTALSGNLASLARLQNQSLNAETIRLNDELAALRVILHGIRLQMNSVLMERNLQLAGGSQTIRPSFTTTELSQAPRSHSSSNPGTKL